MNHDWLKNRLIPGVEAALSLVRGLVVDPEVGPERVSSLLVEWDSRRREVCALVESFEGSMTLGNVLGDEPLRRAGLTDECAQWLRELCHEEWRKAVQSDALKRRCDAAIDAVDTAVAGVRGALRVGRAEAELEAYLVALREVGQALSAFPRRVVLP